jgi:uncharacterized membrane protein YgcG
MEKCEKCGRYMANEYPRCECENSLMNDLQNPPDIINLPLPLSDTISIDGSNLTDSSNSSFEFGGGDFGGGGSGGEW